jgi:hypothetical protein
MDEPRAALHPDAIRPNEEMLVAMSKDRFKYLCVLAVIKQPQLIVLKRQSKYWLLEFIKEFENL